MYVLINIIFNLFFGIFFKEDVKYDLKIKNKILDFFKKLDYFFFLNKSIDFNSTKKDFFNYPLVSSFFVFNNFDLSVKYSLGFKDLYRSYEFFSFNFSNLNLFFSKYFNFIKLDSKLLHFIILTKLINLNFFNFSSRNYSNNLNFLVLLFLNKNYNNNYKYRSYNFNIFTNVLDFYRHAEYKKLNVDPVFSNNLKISKRLLNSVLNYKLLYVKKYDALSVNNDLVLNKFTNWYLNVSKNLYDKVLNIWPVKFSSTDVVKYIRGENLNNYSILFLRKNKVFNKGRYSRNRQIYRTGVYWCLYINIIAMVGLYFWFYRFTINYGYVWWLLFIFIASFIVPKAIKYRLYNPNNLFNSLVLDFKWLGFQLFIFNRFFISILFKFKNFLLSNILVFNLILRKFNFSFVEKFGILLIENLFSFVTFYFYYKNKNFSKKNSWLYRWEFSQFNNSSDKFSIIYYYTVSSFVQFFKMIFSR
jgi:hypothetical protein